LSAGAATGYHRGVAPIQTLGRVGRPWGAWIVAAALWTWGGGARAGAEDPSALERAAAAAQAAQERYDAGDFDAAISLWSEVLMGLPRTAAQAPRRASLVLAIAGALERAYLDQRDPMRLRAALDLLDAYLGDLDPADDENRGMVEERRRALAARLALEEEAAPVEAGGDDRGPRGAPEGVYAPEAPGRRWVITGGSLMSLGAGGLVMMGVGMALGEQADRDVARAVARSVVELGRAEAIAGARARGVEGNRLAWSGALIGGALMVAGALVMAQGRRLRVQARARAGGLAIAF